jgi:putative flippase GtrA
MHLAMKRIELESANSPNEISVSSRFARFSAVGAAGMAVQAATLAILLRMTGMHYLAATALAVEASILHNFAWHMRWTWSDRPASRVILTLLKFNATTGAASLIGNIALMFLFVGVLKLNPQVSNLIAIAVCSLLNFALADRFVFV